MGEPGAQTHIQAASGRAPLRLSQRSTSGRAVLAEADAPLSTSVTGAELCRTIRSTLAGRQVLPTIPAAVAGRAREVFDGEEQAVLAGIPRGRIASMLGVSSAGLDLRLWQMLNELGVAR